MDKTILIGIGIFLLLAIGVIFLGLSKSEIQINLEDYNFDKMPEECRPPYGQDVNSWKEHLGHHENTKYCLDYYK